MPKYTVACQVIEVFNIEVEADSPEGAVDYVAHEFSAAEIREAGYTLSAEVDHVEVIK